MPEYPLLLFPEPTRAERTKRRGFGGRLHIPAPGRQAQRLAPQFQALERAMERRNVALQDSTLGVQPEQVLVMEIIGSINGFMNVVKNIDGLEWLGEFESDPIDSAHGFQDQTDAQKQLSGQLFMVMTDQEALRQMVSYFRRWQANPDIQFSRELSPLKQAFARLHNIRHWSVEDRLRETGILLDWEERLEFGSDSIPFEAELWFRGSDQRRVEAESYVRGIVQDMGGEVQQQCVIPEIGYHAVLGLLPRSHVQEMLEDPDALQKIALLRCDGIMYFRPVGQCIVVLPEGDDTVPASRTDPIEGEELGDPIVALLDGLPLTRHRLLRNRVDVDDPDDYERTYQANERQHGTAMASLICHGDLDDGGSPVGRRIYARPIMQPRRGFDGQFHESIPHDVLPVDLIHRAVRRLFEPERDQLPVAPQVRVINLSVCDAARPFNRLVSPLARLLDWLAWKYSVLFIVSAGNHFHNIQLRVDRAELSKLKPNERQGLVIQALAEDTRNRRLLSPAETLNGLTIGATHQDGSVDALNGYFGAGMVDPFEERGLPSVINAQGPGYRRTIKPDLLQPGGRQFLTEKLGTTHASAILEVRGSTRAPGQLVATPGSQGNLNGTFYIRGTSNAAAVASRSTMFLYDVLEQLRLLYPGSLSVKYDAVLLKALLAHGSDWGGAWRIYEQALKNGSNSRNFKEYVARFFGYGLANVSKVLSCTDQRVTVLGVGHLLDGEGDHYTLPLPPSLSFETFRRRLTVTLAWLTPVISTHQKYRAAHLWFDPLNQNEIARRRLYADSRAAQRGTLQHEILTGQAATAFQDGDGMVIAINCRADAGVINQPVRYAVAVTLEISENLDIPIYEEVRSRLALRIRV